MIVMIHSIDTTSHFCTKRLQRQSEEDNFQFFCEQLTADDSYVFVDLLSLSPSYTSHDVTDQCFSSSVGQVAAHWSHQLIYQPVIRRSNYWTHLSAIVTLISATRFLAFQSALLIERMFQEDIGALSKILQWPLPALQKMPLDQIGCLCAMIRSCPDILRRAAQNVSIDSLHGKF